MVKKFKFRLERLQKLRERVREQRQLAHAQAVDYQTRVEGQIDQIRRFQSDQLELLAQELSQPTLNIEKAIQHRSYDAVLGGLQNQLGRQLEQVKHVVSVRHADLMNAERDVRVLEKLEQRVRQRYHEAIDRAEQQMLDESAATGRLRMQQGNLL